MILDRYKERVDLLIKHLEENIQWGRTNALMMNFLTEEMVNTDSFLIRTMGECFLAKKDILRVERGLLNMVSALENGDDLDEFYSSLEERFFNPFTCSPLCILYGNGESLIESSFDLEFVKKKAAIEILGGEVGLEENHSDKDEICNEYRKYLDCTDELLNMIIQKKDRIDILLYLKKNIL